MWEEGAGCDALTGVGDVGGSAGVGVGWTSGGFPGMTTIESLTPRLRVLVQALPSWGDRFLTISNMFFCMTPILMSLPWMAIS